MLKMFKNHGLGGGVGPFTVCSLPKRLQSQRPA